MKKIKKFASIILAMVMVLAMSLTAFAENDAVDGESYNAYKIFDATVSNAGTSYSIDGESVWLSAVQNYTGTKPTLTQSADKEKYVVTVPENFDTTAAASFAAYLATNVPNGATAYKATAGTGTTTIEVNGDGYYLITSSLGATAALVTDGSNQITIVEKNTAPVVDKVIDENDAYAQIGSKVGFTITITDGIGTDKEITLHDQMSNGLTLDVSSFDVTVDGSKVEESNYTLTTGAQAEAGDTFTIVFNAEYIKSLGTSKQIVVKYKATVNENALTVDKINNKAFIDYSNQDNTSSKEVEIKTNSFEVLKYVAGDTKEANLAGATFQLKQGDTVIKLIKVSNTEYRVAMANETGAVESFTTVADDNIVIKGVDSDLVYTLVETEAPDGYNLLTSPVTVIVNANNSTVAKIGNSAGSTLPSTGGTGTTVLYTIGIILVLGAGILLVVRRRMSVSR